MSRWVERVRPTSYRPAMRERIQALLTVAILRLAAAILVAGVASAEPSVAQPVAAEVDRWDGDDRGELAGKLISRCLARADSSPSHDRFDCVRYAMDLCEREHGTTQLALNECTSASLEAWRSRAKAFLNLLLSAKTIDPKFGRAEPYVEQLRESQQRWVAWNRSDCDLQSAKSIGGSIHPMEMNICLLDHFAFRALELEDLSFWWKKSFKVDSQESQISQ